MQLDIHTKNGAQNFTLVFAPSFQMFQMNGDATVKDTDVWFKRFLLFSIGPNKVWQVVCVEFGRGSLAMNST